MQVSLGPGQRVLGPGRELRRRSRGGQWVGRRLHLGGSPVRVAATRLWTAGGPPKGEGRPRRVQRAQAVRACRLADLVSPTTAHRSLRMPRPQAHRRPEPAPAAPPGRAAPRRAGLACPPALCTYSGSMSRDPAPQNPTSHPRTFWRQRQWKGWAPKSPRQASLPPFSASRLVQLALAKLAKVCGRPLVERRRSAAPGRGCQGAPAPAAVPGSV
jgi:hypothetical protein